MTKLPITPVSSGKTYDVKVRARNMAGNYSAFNSVQQIGVPASTTAPTTPTSLSASSQLKYIIQHLQVVLKIL